MSLSKKHSIEIPLKVESYEIADSFIKEWMTQHRISDNSFSETMLLFEALFQDMIDQGISEDTILTIKAQRSFGAYNINLDFDGKAYIPSIKKKQEKLSPELRVVQAYSDKVGYSYYQGFNSISIVVKRNYNTSLMYCFIAVILAVLVSLPLHSFVEIKQLYSIDSMFLQPIIKQFANAMLMIGAPVTFFSLVKNMTDIYIVSERNSSAGKLQVKTITTSIIAIVLAIGTGVLIAYIMNSQHGYLKGLGTFVGGMTIPEFISSLVPSSIFEPFETYMPFPIIILSLFLTYALCSIGEYFDAVQKFIDTCMALFSKMVSVVMYTLPFFCFLSVLSLLMIGGTAEMLLLLKCVLFALASLVVIAAFYLVRLLIGKVNVLTFARHLPGLIIENLKINSAIDAVPFNIRYCSRKYGYSLKGLSSKLPILAHTNQDGNCFLIMLLSLIFIFLLGIEISWLQIIVIGVLVLFLSVGAPNQPGSIVIGMLIITLYLKADSLILIAIFAEVFFGSIQNIINVLGDIVTVAIEEQKLMKE